MSSTRTKGDLLKISDSPKVSSEVVKLHSDEW